MKRRELIKGLVAFGAIALTPDFGAKGSSNKPNIHFVGLGSGGTNAMVHIYRKGIKAEYSCITGRYVSHMSPEMQHVFYEPTQDYRIHGVNYQKRLELTDRMRSVFRNNNYYVVLAGMGGCTATGLISNVVEFLCAEKKNFLAVCSLPFANEGRARRDYANLKMKELKGLDNVLFFDQNQITDTVLSKRFAAGNELFYSIFTKHCPQTTES